MTKFYTSVLLVIFSYNLYSSVKTIEVDKLKCFKLRNVENVEIRQSKNWYGFSYQITKKDCKTDGSNKLIFQINSGKNIQVTNLPKSKGGQTHVRITYKSNSIVNDHIITVREI
ncbi:MAG: hypothetical protein H6622_17185 [Halobacteriovoraceae bacterium]|nr:hypothetical protein [Halobacteriovoraceae bacterium]